MSLVDGRPKVGKTVPCAACAQPAAEGWEVWGHRLCLDCVGAWRALPGLAAGEMAAELGGWNMDAMVKAWEALTGAWVKQRRAAVVPLRVAR